MSSATVQGRPRIDPRIAQRRVKVKRAHGRRRLRTLAVMTLATLVLGSAWLLLHSSPFSARHVSVEGTFHTPLSEVLSASGLGRHPPLLDVDPGAVSARLEALPWISRASVERRWPDSVAVIVTERAAVASLEQDGTFVVLDRTGRVLALSPRAPAGTVPIVLSRPVAIGPPGSTVGRRVTGGLAVAAGIPPPLEEKVQAVEVGAGGGIALELQGSTRALFGPATELNEKFEALTTVLDEVPIGGPVQIDLTVPDEPTIESQPA